MKLKPPTIHRPYHVNYLQGFWYLLLKEQLYKVIRLGRRLHLKGNLKVNFKQWFKKKDRTLTIRIRWVVAGLLLLALWPHPHKVIYADPISPAPKVHKIALISKLPETSLAPVAALDPIPVYVPPPPPQPAYVAPVGVTACGSDPNMAYIYMHESGCRTDAIGPNGPCGLGQALPCSKLPCSLSDWNCENSWFTNYAISVYGSTYNAYIFWTNHSWW